MLPEEDWIMLAAPALVDQALWDRVQERLAVNKSRFGGNPKTTSMLSGRVFCPHCGGTLIRNGPGPGRPTVYACLAHREAMNRYGQVVCTAARYPVSVIEAATVDAIAAACEQPESIAAALAAYAEPLAPTPMGKDRGRGAAAGAMAAGAMAAVDMAAVDKALAEIKADEAAAVHAQIAGIRAGASPDAYAEAFAEIAARRKDLEGRRSEALRADRQARREKDQAQDEKSQAASGMVADNKAASSSAVNSRAAGDKGLTSLPS